MLTRSYTLRPLSGRSLTRRSSTRPPICASRVSTMVASAVTTTFRCLADLESYVHAHVAVHVQHDAAVDELFESRPLHLEAIRADREHREDVLARFIRHSGSRFAGGGMHGENVNPGHAGAGSIADHSMDCPGHGLGAEWRGRNSKDADA